MTREEAIKILKEERWYMSRYSEEYKEAYDMAIEALSAETPTIAEKHQLSEETPTNTPTVFIDGIGNFPKLTETYQNLSKTNNTCEVDLISRADAIKAMADNLSGGCSTWAYLNLEKAIKALPSADAVPQLKQTDTLIIADALRYLIKDTERHELDRTRAEVLREQILQYGASMCSSADAVHGEWIPCGEKMPKELERVNVTWLNHNPPFYYQHIKDIPQTDTAVYYRGKWYWWDATVIDVLAEYGEDCNAEQIDKDIEVVAWMPLPKPYKGGDWE